MQEERNGHQEPEVLDGAEELQPATDETGGRIPSQSDFLIGHPNRQGNPAKVLLEHPDNVGDFVGRINITQEEREDMVGMRMVDMQLETGTVDYDEIVWYNGGLGNSINGQARKEYTRAIGVADIMAMPGNLMGRMAGRARKTTNGRNAMGEDGG